MDFGAAVSWILSGVYLFCACAFIFQRSRWRRKNRRGKKNAGFYPTYSSLGGAFQVLHKEFVLPEMAYMYEEQMNDEADEDDEGGEIDPEKYLMRQLRRVRNGEEVEVLKVMVRSRDTGNGDE
jgi:hypothetical protein